VLSTEQTQRSLWLGDLPPWIDEGFLFNLFAGTNQLVSVKLIRNRATGASEGYAFLEFRTHEAADSILKTYNGHPIPGTELVFRLNWAAFGVGKAQPGGEGELRLANLFCSFVYIMAARSLIKHHVYLPVLVFIAIINPSTTRSFRGSYPPHHRHHRFFLVRGRPCAGCLRCHPPRILSTVLSFRPQRQGKHMHTRYPAINCLLICRSSSFLCLVLSSTCA
jgi:RNA recognition motif-containing protein